MFPPLTLRAPAKLNLHLRVFPKGPDGFHPLRSWFRVIDLFDDLTVALVDENALASPLQRAGSRPVTRELQLTCSDPLLPTDGRNLVRKAWNLRPAAVAARATLIKRIPAGGGLGGGSSDAASMLVATARLDRHPLPMDRQSVAPATQRPSRPDGSRGSGTESNPTRGCRHGVREAEQGLSRLAVALGSDVPFFLQYQLDGITDATCTGRGEGVAPFAPVGRHTPLVLLTGIDCPTPAVYRQFDDLPAPPDEGEPDFAQWSALPAVDLLPRLRNDLEPAAFALRPDLAAVRLEAENKLGRPVRMTGSGGTLFTLFDAAGDAGRAAESLRGWPAVTAVVA